MKARVAAMLMLILAGCTTHPRQVEKEAKGIARFRPSQPFEGIEILSVDVNGKDLPKGKSVMAVPSETATNITATFMLGNGFSEMVFLKWRVSDVKAVPSGIYSGEGDLGKWGIQTYQQLYGTSYTGLRPPRGPKFDDRTCSMLLHSGEAVRTWTRLSITYDLHIDYYIKGDRQHYVADVPVTVDLRNGDTEPPERDSVPAAP
jgi:hypothetical protein